MTRPKQLPNELLSDLSVSAATKLQKLRHLGKYFKQSAEALEKQVDREARFYGSLLRLQENWKVKRQRQPVPGNEGFSFDLHDTSSSDSAFLTRPSPMSMVRVEHDPTGMLALQSSLRSYRRMHFGFSPESYIKAAQKSLSTKSDDDDNDDHRGGGGIMIEAPTAEAVDRSARRAHAVLREIHRAIFEEQVFDMINREIVDNPNGVNVAGMREDYLHLKVGPETSIYMRLQPSEGEAIDGADALNLPLGSPNPRGLEIYLRSLLQGRTASRGRPLAQGVSLLGYFCAAVAHRVFSVQVSSMLERLVEGLPYLRLQTQPTWHSRLSSWSLNLSVPLSMVNPAASDRPRIHTTNVLVTDELISVRGEGIPSIVGSAGYGSAINCYGCDLTDLPWFLLQQVATQVVSWLHGEAARMGIKASVDFLALCLELGRGERLRLVARVDPEAELSGISWWLVADGEIMPAADEGRTDAGNTRSESLQRRKFLGHLSLDSLYSLLMDLLRLSNPPSNGHSRS
ncbi:RNA polymerase II transcription mediator isoform X2 [Wolffia australiana]